MARHQRVLITGCSGYVGRQLITLMAQRGYRLTGSCRKAIEIRGVNVRIGDLRDKKYMRHVVEGQDVIVHAAGLTRSQNREALIEANEKVVSSLVGALKESGSCQLIFLSSDLASHRVGVYGESKRNCEEIIRSQSPNFAVLRLTPVLGEFSPGENSTFSRIIRQVAFSRYILMPGNGDFPIAPVFINDIVSVIESLIDNPKALQKVYGMAGEFSTYSDFLSLVEERLAIKKTRISIPLSPLKAMALLLKKVPGTAYLPLDSILNIGRPVAVDSTSLAKELAFTPTPLREAIYQIPFFPEVKTYHEAH